MLRYNSKIAQMVIARRNIAGRIYDQIVLPSRRCVLFSNKAASAVDDDSTTTATTDSTFDIHNEYTKSYQLQGVGIGPTVEVTTNTGHTIKTDLPKPMGGTNVAPQPVEMLLTAWMGCTQATALFVGRHMQPERLVIEKLLFDTIQGYRDERGALQLPLLPKAQQQTAASAATTTTEDDDDSASSSLSIIPSRLQRVTGTIYVFAKTSRRDKEYISLSNDQLEILKHQTETRCPVANMMIASGCAIDVEWIDGASIDRSIDRSIDNITT